MSATVVVGKSQRAYHHIRDRIADGTLGPGYRLVLGQIAAELDVSVVPVREAVRMLEAEGLVTFQRNVGAQVAMLDDTEYQRTMQVLSVVEGAATALSAPHLEQADLRAARALNARMAACLEDLDPRRFTELNRDFHALLYGACPNEQLLELVRRGWHRLGALRWSTFGFVPGRAAESVREHERLLALVEAGADPWEVERAVRDHRSATLTAFLDHQRAQGAGAP